MDQGIAQEFLSGKSERWRVVLLLVVTILVYANTLLNSFTYDDFLYILNNPAVTAPTLKGFLEPTRAFNLFRPVTFLSFALNWAVGFIHPFSYHLVNLLLHAAVTLLLYLLCCKVLERMPEGDFVALAAALLFAVHPIHTEAVASIVGRSEMLAAGFLLAAWLLHLRDRQILELVCLVLALLSKESAVCFLPLALAGDYARGEFKPRQRYFWIAGVSALYVGVLWKVQGGRFGEVSVNFLDNPLASLPATWRILNALRVAWKYVGLLIYPGALSYDYSYNAIRLYEDWRHTFPAAVAAIAVLALWLWALWSRRRGWVLAGAIYFAGFAVTANALVPTGTIMGERLAYFPSAGFCLLLALMWVRLKKLKAAWAWAALIVLAGALGARSVVRNRDWRTNFTLFSAGVRAVPGSSRAHCNMGGQYLDSGQLDAALTEFQTALAIYPDYPDALEYSGLIESRRGHDQQALELLERAFFFTRKESTRYGERAVNLAAMFMKVGQGDEAMGLLNQAIEVAPGNARAWANRAVIHYWRGNVESARVDAETALLADPSNPQAQKLLEALRTPTRVAPR